MVNLETQTILKATDRLFHAGRFAEAAFEIRKVLRNNPRDWGALKTLAEIREAQGQFDKAESLALRACAIAPGVYAPYRTLAQVLRSAGRIERAQAVVEAALQRFPLDWEPHADAAHLFVSRGAYEQASACFDRALSLNPQALLLNLDQIMIKLSVCNWSDYARDVETLRSSALKQGSAGLITLMSVASTLEEQLLAARGFAARFRRPTRLHIKRPRTHSDRAKLRIGYLSGDFYEHPTSFLVRELIEQHDRHQFEIIGFSYGPDDKSQTRQRLIDVFDDFIDLSRLSDHNAADCIASNSIDILVDLKGYTRDCRPGILGFRPALIQVNYLGFPGTMGADFIDYGIADSMVVPPGYQNFCDEKIVELPGCFQPNDARRSIDLAPLSRSDVGLPEDRFVFCSFSQAYKLTPETFDNWAHILRAVPASVLWLLKPAGRGAERLMTEAASRGVDPSRIIFAPAISNPKHLARLPLADLCLDTMPMGAFTTASDALWMGLPILTLVGETPAGRGASSLLSAIGTPDLIAHNLDDYVTTAIELSRSPERLAALRERIIAGRTTSSVFDAGQRARALELAYTHMAERFHRGLPPEPFKVVL